MKIKIVACIVYIIILCCGCNNRDSVLNNLKENENIRLVKNTTFKEGTDLTFVEAFDNFFESPSWSYIQDNPNKNIVKFKGNCIYKHTNIKVIIEFSVDNLVENYEISKLFINNIEYDDSTIDRLFNSINNCSSNIMVNNTGQNNYTTLNDSDMFYSKNSGINMSDWLGTTVQDIINNFGENYTINGYFTKSITYSDSPYSFYFQTAGSSDISGNEKILSINVYNNGKVNKSWNCGMSESEIENNIDARYFIDRDNEEDDIGGIKYLRLLMSDAEYTFTWFTGETTNPCDMVSINAVNS